MQSNRVGLVLPPSRALGRPQPLAPWLGAPFLFHVLANLEWAGCRRIYLQIGRSSEAVAQAVREWYAGSATIQLMSGKATVHKAVDLGFAQGNAVWIQAMDLRLDKPAVELLSAEAARDAAPVIGATAQGSDSSLPVWSVRSGWKPAGSTDITLIDNLRLCAKKVELSDPQWTFQPTSPQVHTHQIAG